MKYKITFNFTPMNLEVGMRDENQQTSQQSYPYTRADFPSATLSALQLTESVKQALLDLDQRLGESNQIERIRFHGSLSGWLPLDSAYQPVTDILSASESNQHFIDALIMNGIGKQLQNKTGVPLSPSVPLIMTIALKDNEPDLFAKSVHFMGVFEYLLYQLFGLNVIEPAHAARTGFYNVLKQDWDPQALAIAGVQRAQLPEISRPNNQVVAFNHVVSSSNRTDTITFEIG